VDAALVAADTFTRQAREIMLLSVYEGRLTRIMEKQRAELKAIQSERKEAREKAANQAAIFVEHAESKGKEYDPGEIALRRDRERRYNNAWHYHFRDSSKDPRPDLGPIIDVKTP
jgi:hypothetical protein